MIPHNNGRSQQKNRESKNRKSGDMEKRNDMGPVRTASRIRLPKPERIDIRTHTRKKITRPNNSQGHHTNSNNHDHQNNKMHLMRTMPRRLEPILEMRKIQANMAVPSTGSAAGATLSELVGENLEAPPAVAIERVGFVVVCA